MTTASKPGGRTGELLGEALARHRAGALKEAERGYRAVLELEDSNIHALTLLGTLHLQSGDFSEAERLLGRSLTIEPRQPLALNNRANALAQLKRFEEAIDAYERAIGLAPDQAETYNNYGNALRATGRSDEALAKFDRAIALKPDYVEARFNRATALQHHQRYREAIVDYDRAIALKANHAQAHAGRGDALRRLKLSEDAIKSYDEASRLRPDDPGAYYGRCLARFELGRLAEALADIEKVLALAPEFPYALGVRVLIKGRLCDWNGLREADDALVFAIERGLPAAIPFALLAIDCPPAIRQQCAVQYVRDKWPVQSSLVPRRAAHERLRVAYLSADFRAHATSSLMAGVFEHHDKTQFEMHAISFGPDDGSEMRSRVRHAFEHFLDVRAMDDRAVAAQMKEREIDIAVDLMGFTDESRPGILALRPAPVQVNYLGFPGTMGADFIDYIIADEIVIPEDHARYITEKIAYLPETYQCNDAKRAIAGTSPSRSAAGLPEGAFVFTSFNRAFKITPWVFDVWMRLLRQCDASVLWLLKSDIGVAENLRREAETRGVAGERLIFAPTVSLPDHLARQRLADLFLDTLPCGAHTTASEALWAGLPVLTCKGDSFAGRVAASLLHAIGLPELAADSLAEYEATALSLARNPQALMAMKHKLLDNRDRYPLFDTARFTRHLEAAYVRMWNRHRGGEPPATFRVAALPRA